MHWAQLEPAPGEFDWGLLDQLAPRAAQHNLRLMVTVGAISPWGSSRLPPNWGKPGYHAASPPRDMMQYASFVRALVTRYRGRGIAWQIGNEPNASAFWGGTQEEYLALLPAGLACGFSRLGGTDFKLAQLGSWFNAVLDSRAFDALDLHDYYPPEPGNAWGLTFEQYIQAFERWMSARGVTAPLWISEAGASSVPVRIGSQQIPFTPAAQARALEQIYGAARQHRIAHVFWLKLIDGPEEGPFTSMGLIAKTRERKPAAATYRRLATSN